MKQMRARKPTRGPTWPLYPAHTTQSQELLINYIDTKLPEDTKFTIPDVSVTFIANQIKTLENSKGTGLDGISANYLKLVADIVSPVLAKIFNLSLHTGIFPDQLKKAKITPIHKKGSKNDTK